MGHPGPASVETEPDPGLMGLVQYWAVLFAAGLILILDPIVGYLAPQLPSIARPTSPAYHIRHLLMHTSPRPAPGETRLTLIGSSVVYADLHERRIARALSGPGRQVTVANLGLQGAYTLSVVILAHQLRSIGSGLVVWGVNADTMSPNMDGFRADVCPWRRPMAAEFGAGVVYEYVPGLPGRHRALSDEFTLDHWALYRYRLYYRQYLLALYRSRREGSSKVFGPYVSRTGTANPARLEAALARRLKNAAEGRHDPGLPPTDQLEAVIGAVDSMVREAGGRLLIVWLPTALDGLIAPPPVLALTRSACAARGVPFIDLRGVAPASSFRDTLHATAEGKRQITDALIPHLRRALQPSPRGGS